METLSTENIHDILRYLPYADIKSKASVNKMFARAVSMIHLVKGPDPAFVKTVVRLNNIANFKYYDTGDVLETDGLIEFKGGKILDFTCVGRKDYQTPSFKAIIEVNRNTENSGVQNWSNSKGKVQLIIPFCTRSDAVEKANGEHESSGDAENVTNCYTTILLQVRPEMKLGFSAFRLLSSVLEDVNLGLISVATMDDGEHLGILSVSASHILIDGGIVVVG
jgi:hypothetical protein